jgi:hypothetical protein
MKKDKDDIRPEYRREDLGPGVRGKFYEEFRQGTNLVLLSPDVAAVFPDDKAVNDALRALVQVAQRASGLGMATQPKRRKSLARGDGSQPT